MENEKVSLCEPEDAANGSLRVKLSRLFSSQLEVNVISSVFCSAINLLSIFIGYPLYLKYLGYEKFGVWLVLTTILTIVQMGNIGIDQATIKLVAEEYGRGNREKVQGYASSAVIILSVIGTIILALIVFFKSQIIGVFKLEDGNAQLACRMLPYVAVLSVYVFVVQTINAVLIGLGRMDFACYIQAIGRIVTLLVAWTFLHMGYGIESLLFGGIACYVVIHIASLVGIKRISKINFIRGACLDIQCAKRILTFGGGVFGGTFLNMFLSPFNKLILSRYVGVSSVPIYEVAFNGSMQIRGLIETGLRALMPEISNISADIKNRTREKIEQLNRFGMKIIWMIGMPMYCVLILFMPIVLKLWLGDNFTETSVLPFRILLIGTFFSLLCVPAYYTLMGLGKIGSCFSSYAIQSGVNVILIILILLISGEISICSIGLTLTTAMIATSIYVIVQKNKTLYSGKDILVGK